MPYTAGLATDLLPDRYGVIFVPHRHTRRFVRPIKETGKRPRPDRMGLGLFFCKACRKIMPPGGARVLKSAHHDAAVVFGGVALSGAFAPLPGLRLPASASLPLASRWPRPQQLLPVSAAGGGRRRCSQRERLKLRGKASHRSGTPLSYRSGSPPRRGPSRRPGAAERGHAP